MNHVLSAILLAISSNLDNLGVGFAYGIRARRIRVRDNLLIAVVSGSGTLVSMAAGEWTNDFLAEDFANVLGAALMVLIGLFIVVQALRGSRDDLGAIAARFQPRGSDSETTAREGLALAVSLSFNNLGNGLGAGISHVSIALTTSLTLAASLAAIAGGFRLARRGSVAMSRRHLGVASGLLIVAVGIYEYFV